MMYKQMNAGINFLGSYSFEAVWSQFLDEKMSYSEF